MDAPTSRVTFHGFMLVDVTTKPPVPVTPQTVYNSRQEGRTAKEWRPDADHIRVRRARITVYES